MDSQTITELGNEIRTAEETQSPERPISERFEEVELEDAYSVQEEYSRLREENGAELIGRKIGCTSEAIQNRFSIDQPDYGRIFDDMVIDDGGSVPTDELIAPMVEPEIGFVIGENIQGPGITRQDVLEATEAIAPCIEIIDSRIVDWEISFVDTIADNGSSARCVFGMQQPLNDDLNLAAEQVELFRGADKIEGGTGEAVLGHPAEAVAWLANALADFGEYLRRNQWVLSGAITNAAPAVKGETYVAKFQKIGQVSCSFN